MFKLEEFRTALAEKPISELWDILRDQDPEIAMQAERIEWVFRKKLSHLTGQDGLPITQRDLTKKELISLIDPPFHPDSDLTRAGISNDDQRQIFVARDTVLWAKHYLGAKPRAYQTMILRDPSTRKVIRMGRRLGKTYSLALRLLHYSFVTKNGRCLVMAPMKSHVELIYKQAMEFIGDSVILQESVKRAVTSPQFAIELFNGSTINFFTTGMKSGGKADVARGQEAHIIVLDEFDYMAPDDLDALYAMLQQTAEDQIEKELIGASTPTGRKETFWDWSHDPDFSEFYYPSYVNPFWGKKMEKEQRARYNPMAYRHEIEADWGEDSEGVYPRRHVDTAFRSDWLYTEYRTTQQSFYVMGVDWDKYGAGTNIVVLEACKDNYDGDPKFAGKMRVAYREETPKEEFSLSNSVQRIIHLNELMRPNFIYIDRGFGEVQCEMLLKYGMEHPWTGLKEKVKGISFSESLEIRDPVTRQLVKKEIKPFMVDTLYRYLENEQIMLPDSDHELYMQLISYVVERYSVAGRPVFGSSGSQVDHAHDALILACLAVAQNYGEFTAYYEPARKSYSVSNETFLPTFSLSNDQTEREWEEEYLKDNYGSTENGPVQQKRRNLRGSAVNMRGGYKRSMF